jgi:hypothetical protein
MKHPVSNTLRVPNNTANFKADHFRLWFMQEDTAERGGIIWGVDPTRAGCLTLCLEFELRGATFELTFDRRVAVIPSRNTAWYCSDSTLFAESEEGILRACYSEATRGSEPLRESLHTADTNRFDPRP